MALSGSIITLLREPVTLLYQNISKAQKLKRSLGQWHGEAIDYDKQCRIPVLREKEFEEYLVDTDGRLCMQATIDHGLIPGTNSPDYRETSRKSWGLPWSQNANPQPDKSPTAKACWAYILHALGICPGMGIVGWRPSNDGFVSTQNGGIEMEIDGAVLCHIMNLYIVPIDHTPSARDFPERILNCTEQKLCKFPFGRLAWDEVNGRIHAHFEPGLEAELNAEKRPFGVFGSMLEADTCAATYFTALVHGVSDPELRLADATAPLEERIETFLRCLKKLAQTAKPRVISYGWFEEAAHVKRRVLAQGGKVQSLFRDLCETVGKKAPFYNEIVRKDMKDMVRRHFLWGTETFQLWLPGVKQQSYEPVVNEKLLKELATETLDGYKHQSRHTWTHKLYCMKETVMNVLMIRNRIMIGRNTWLLEFTRDCPLWNERVLLGAPS